MNLEIEQSLRNDRKLRESSIKTYKSTFNKVAKKFGVDQLSAAWLKENTDKVMGWITSQQHGSKIAMCVRARACARAQVCVCAARLKSGSQLFREIEHG